MFLIIAVVKLSNTQTIFLSSNNCRFFFTGFDRGTICMVKLFTNQLLIYIFPPFTVRFIGT